MLRVSIQIQNLRSLEFMNLFSAFVHEWMGCMIELDVGAHLLDDTAVDCCCATGYGLMAVATTSEQIWRKHPSTAHIW